MRKIKDTSKIVKQVLQDFPETRDNDDFLYAIVCQLINPEAMKLPFVTVVTMRKELNLPPRKSVERAGRRMRRLYPELAGSKEAEEQRAINEGVVRAWAVGSE